MDTRTASKNPGERLDDRRPAGPLNWDETPTDEQLKADSEHLEALRRRIQAACTTMLASLREELGLDPLQVVLLQTFDIQTGGIKMQARAIADPMALATVRGKVIEVGNLDGDPGMCIELGDQAGVLTMIGLSQDQLRAIAPHYSSRIEIIVRALPDAAEHIDRLQKSA